MAAVFRYSGDHIDGDHTHTHTTTCVIELQQQKYRIETVSNILFWECGGRPWLNLFYWIETSHSASETVLPNENN